MSNYRCSHVPDPNTILTDLISDVTPLTPQDIATKPRMGQGGLLKLYLILDRMRRWINSIANGGSGGLGGNVFARPTLFSETPVMDFSPDRSYYPTLLHFPGGYTPPLPDTGTYKYVCVCQSYSGSSGLDLRGSNDFKSWTRLASATGLVGLTNPAHPFIVRTPGDVKAYRVYYWDTAQLYSASSIRTADSDDLVTWTNDTALLNGPTPFITGVGPDWNRGSYGPGMVFFNPSASNTGPDPFDYRYILFFDATTGGVQSVGLAVSADGITFDLHDEVFKYNSRGWDATHVSSFRMVQIPDGTWIALYSGGDGASNQGIGLAVSSDRLNWQRLTYAAPLVGLNPLTWREGRAYAAGVLADFSNSFKGAGDEAVIKMLVSGRSESGDYTMGYFYWPSLYTEDANNALIPTTV